jgi:hypothetical protein
MRAHDTGVFDDSYFVPYYNVARHSMQPVVRLDSETGQRDLTRPRAGCRVVHTDRKTLFLLTGHLRMACRALWVALGYQQGLRA